MRSTWRSAYSCGVRRSTRCRASAGAVARHADLRRAVERAVAPEERARRAARSARRTSPGCADAAASRRAGASAWKRCSSSSNCGCRRRRELANIHQRSAPRCRVASTRRTSVEQHALEAPAQREVDAAVELDRAVARALRDHVELAVLLDEERDTTGGSRARAPCTGADARPSRVDLDHRDVRLAGGAAAAPRRRCSSGRSSRCTKGSAQSRSFGGTRRVKPFEVARVDACRCRSA